MSDDEVLRRRLPLVAVAAALVLGGGAWWLRARMLDDVTAFKAFCSATHVGEPLEHVQERAVSRGYEFVPERSRPAEPGLPRRSDPQEQYLARAELWGYRAGCVVTLSKGRVVSTRFAELP